MKASMSTSAANRFLTFTLARETYGVRVLSVQEILQLTPITRVPQLPAHVRGVINLRGRIIPVIDMRLRFCLPAAPDDSRTCVVVVHITSTRRGDLHMGLVVDAVDEVVQIAQDDISQTPEFGCAVDTAFLLGMAKVKGAVTTLLDLDRVLTGPELDQLAAETSAAG